MKSKNSNTTNSTNITKTTNQKTPKPKVKNLQDPRYLHNHQKFFRALDHLRLRHIISLRPVHLWHQAGLSKSTFYRHFPSLDQALTAEEVHLLTLYKSDLAQLKSPTDSRAVITLISIFILRHRDYFLAAHRCHSAHLLHQILAASQTALTTSWQIQDQPLKNRIFTIYCGIFSTIITDWASKNLLSRHADEALNHLIHFTAQFQTHLGAISIIAAASI